MKYDLYTRPYNLGRQFWYRMTVEAESIQDACQQWLLYDDKIHHWENHQEGTKEKPYIFNGGASEIYAEMEPESVVKAVYPNAIEIAGYNEDDCWSTIYDGNPVDEDDDFGTIIGWARFSKEAWQDAAERMRKSGE